MCPGQCEGVILIMRPGQAVAMLRLPVNRSNTDGEERIVAAAADSGGGGKNCIRRGQRSGYARMERRTGGLRTQMRLM